MSIARSAERLRLPESLEAQLHDFRRRVWSIKMTEAGCAAVFGLLAAVLALFTLDRLQDTPAWLRLGLFGAAWTGCALVPLAFYRWVWGNRRLEQLARLLARKHPQVGDQLLGIIELVQSDSEQARSRALCEAAIVQVAEEAQKRDFHTAVPRPRDRLWLRVAAVPACIFLGLLLAVPSAATNTCARLLLPWRKIPRYTFAAIEPLPARLTVPHGEPVSITLRLAAKTAWRPSHGTLWLGPERPHSAVLRNDGYTFALPAQIDPGWLELRIGDWRERVHVEPAVRPELTSLVANIALPQYLGRPGELKKDVRGGSIALVDGSQAVFAATASRSLARAQVDGQPRTPQGATVLSPTVSVDHERKLVFQWQDELGLTGKEPFTLTITGRNDEAPSLACEQLPHQKVVLDSEQLSFKVMAQDDFGIKQVGLEWQGAESPLIKTPAQGERLLAAGGSDKESLEVAGTFSAQGLGIEPQQINLRIFAEDYYPGRARVYSPTYTLYVLSPEQHAVWLTEQLSRWHRQSLEVRDRELQLYDTNKQLQALERDELDKPETRKRIERQASAERANGRRLSGLVTSGEDLVRQAMRNPEFGVGHLEKWAEMLQVLKDIAANRMPSVADLLKQASQSSVASASAPGNRAPMAGQMRSVASGNPASGDNDGKPKPPVPQVVDQESSQRSADAKSQPPPAGGSSGSPRLGLVQTTLLGSSPKDNQACPVAQKVDEAVKAQQDLLAEFEKIADELNRVLANLEGSTFVKRLKAASRLQYALAGRLSDQLPGTFGRQPRQLAPEPAKVLVELGKEEAKSSHTVSVIMDDMQAYFERRQLLRIRTVLEEMKQQDVIGSLRQISEDLSREHGVSIAQCEFWSDTLDRWADDLVDPVSGGT